MKLEELFTITASILIGFFVIIWGVSMYDSIDFTTTTAKELETLRVECEQFESKIEELEKQLQSLSIKIIEADE